MDCLSQANNFVPKDEMGLESRFCASLPVLEMRDWAPSFLEVSCGL